MERQAYQTAIEWVLNAGRLVRTRLESNLRVQTKTSHADLVTEIDVQVEQFLVERIREQYPDHAIIGEESVDRGHPEGDYMWIIDPIDGTTNMINRKKDFAISVALCGPQGGIFGIVYDVMGETLYRAFKGDGAFVNDARLERMPDHSRLSDELVAMTIPFERLRTDETLIRYIPVIEQARGIRIYGASTMELCDLAKGLIGAYVQHAIHAWDYAACRVMLEELGCTFTDMQGEPIPWTYNGGIVVASPAVHAEIVRLLQSAPSDAS